MAKFLIKDRMACYVTWTYEIEAKDESDAYDKFCDGDHGAPVGEPEIGDSIEFCEQTTTVVKEP